MNPNHQAWNRQQRELQQALLKPLDHQQAVELFLCQHAAVHSAAMSGRSLWSFEDDIWQDVGEQDARSIPAAMEHSLVWIFWHLARIEDVTMNLLVAGCPQVLTEGNWLARTNSPICHTGNAMQSSEIAALGETIDLEALRAYRAAVGRRTQEIVCLLKPGDFKRNVQPARLEQIRAQAAVLDAAWAIVDYWSTRTIGGLLLMPATRHNFLHLNEALRIKRSNHQKTTKPQ